LESKFYLNLVIRESQNVNKDIGNIKYLRCNGVKGMKNVVILTVLRSTQKKR
jgi:hypothetical protein